MPPRGTQGRQMEIFFLSLHLLDEDVRRDQKLVGRPLVPNLPFSKSYVPRMANSLEFRQNVSTRPKSWYFPSGHISAFEGIVLIVASGEKNPTCSLLLLNWPSD